MKTSTPNDVRALPVHVVRSCERHEKGHETRQKRIAALTVARQRAAGSTSEGRQYRARVSNLLQRLRMPMLLVSLNEWRCYASRSAIRDWKNEGIKCRVLALPVRSQYERDRNVSSLRLGDKLQLFVEQQKRTPGSLSTAERLLDAGRLFDDHEVVRLATLWLLTGRLGEAAAVCFPWLGYQASKAAAGHLIRETLSA